MKLPTGLTRAIAQQSFLVRQHAPTLLWVGGVACGIGATVSACRSTLRLEPIIDKLEDKLARSNDMHKRRPADYSAQSLSKDKMLFYLDASVGLVKLYSPALVLGTASIVMLASGQSILIKRNAGLSAAYVTLLQGFNDYRSRVIAEHGIEKDREYRFGAEEKTIVEDTDTGPVKKQIKQTTGQDLPYAKVFGPGNGNWGPVDVSNLFFLRAQQNWVNDKLRSRGHVFLNEVYDHLGLERTSAGAVTGWIWDPRNPERQGDGFIDFGVFDNKDGDQFHSLAVGDDGAILLDFNVDGPIWNKINL